MAACIYVMTWSSGMWADCKHCKQLAKHTATKHTAKWQEWHSHPSPCHPRYLCLPVQGIRIAGNGMHLAIICHAKPEAREPCINPVQAKMLIFRDQYEMLQMLAGLHVRGG